MDSCRDHLSIHHRGRTHTMLAATARRSSSVFRGAARVTGTRYFAVRLAAHTHATPPLLSNASRPV
jgi:hypothetical protein